MNRKQRLRVSVLERRRDFLASRVQNYVGTSPSHDKAELAALNWALRVVKAADDENVLHELEGEGVAA